MELSWDRHERYCVSSCLLPIGLFAIYIYMYRCKKAHCFAIPRFQREGKAFCRHIEMQRDIVKDGFSAHIHLRIWPDKLYSNMKPGEISSLGIICTALGYTTGQDILSGMKEREREEQTTGSGGEDIRPYASV